MLRDEAQCAEFSRPCEEVSRENDPSLLDQLFANTATINRLIQAAERNMEKKK